MPLYFTAPNASLAPGDNYTLQWEVSDADCGVFLDGFQVNPTDSITYSAPSDNSYQTWTHTLVTYGGGDCSNPLDVSEVVQIVVEPAPTISILKGSSSVYDSSGLDLDGISGIDVIYDHQASNERLLGSGLGTELWNANSVSVSSCKSAESFGTSSTVIINLFDIVCYKTANGYYGVLTIDGSYLDFDDYSNSYVEISFETEVSP